MSLGTRKGLITEFNRSLSIALTISLKDWRILLRDRRALISMLLVPVVLITILGSALSHFNPAGGTTEDDGKLGKMAVLMKDEGRYAKYLERKLKSQANVIEVQDRAAAKAGLAKGHWAIAAIIPPNFTEKIDGGKKAQVDILIGSARGSGALIGLIYSYVDYLNTAFRAASIALGYSAINGKIDIRRKKLISKILQTGAAQDGDLVSVSKKSPSQGDVNYFNQLVPGYAVMFALFGIGAGAGSLLEEREHGTLRRLLISPVPRSSILTGKLIFQFSITLAQILILLAFGALAFGMSTRSWGMILAATCSLCFATTGFGLLLVAVVKTRRQLSSVTTFLVLGLSAIGGSWFPLWLEPRWMQSIAMISVNYWAMKAFNNLIVFEQGAVSALPYVAVLILYGLLAFVAANTILHIRHEI